MPHQAKGCPDKALLPANATQMLPTLTCAEAQPDASKLLLGEGLVVPDGELGTCLGQVLGLEAVVHHGVVESGAEALFDNAGLLAARLAVIREDVAERRRLG